MKRRKQNGQFFHSPADTAPYAGFTEWKDVNNHRAPKGKPRRIKEECYEL